MFSTAGVGICRFAFRQMRQTPIVSGVALLSLALGIGANVAIFSLVNALILKALPIHEPDRLVMLGRLDDRTPGGSPSTSFTNPQLEYLRDHQDVFAGVTAVGYARFNLNAGGEARPMPGPVRERTVSSTRSASRRSSAGASPTRTIAAAVNGRSRS